jgi:diguanylate cyclase (GGDEF)-like protein
MIKSLLLRLATPGAFPRGLVATASIISIALLCALEIKLGSDVWFAVVYVFPLVAIAIHGESSGLVVLGFLATVAGQIAAILSFHSSHAASSVNALIACAWPLLVVLLARFARTGYLSMAALANQDPLTGLPNRRHFESVLETEVARQGRYGGMFSLAIADLDDFKSLNDSQGHFAGDQALRLLARILCEHTRKSDLVARLGGDEFAILLPNTNGAACNVLIRKLSETVANGMSASGYETRASIGSVSFEQTPKSASAAMQLADEAMYAVKAGRKTLPSQR